jgi:hypothetical protein
LQTDEKIYRIRGRPCRDTEVPDALLTHIHNNIYWTVGLEVFMAVSTKMAVFWVVVPCSLVGVYQCFRGPCCLHHQGHSTRLHDATTQKTAILVWQKFSKVSEVLAACIIRATTRLHGITTQKTAIIIYWTLLKLSVDQLQSKGPRGLSSKTVRPQTYFYFWDHMKNSTTRTCGVTWRMQLILLECLSRFWIYPNAMLMYMSVLTAICYFE